MELFFLLIFFIVVMLNVVLGLTASRRKRKRALSMEASAGEEAQGAEEGGAIPESILAEQNADSLVFSPYAVIEEADNLPRTEEVREETGETPEPPRIQDADGSIPEKAGVSERIRFHAVKRVHSEKAPAVTPLRDRPRELGTLGSPSRTSERRTVSVMKRIEALPPLQRAIVLSEVLGTPKGLSGE